MRERCERASAAFERAYNASLVSEEVRAALLLTALAFVMSDAVRRAAGCSLGAALMITIPSFLPYASFRMLTTPSFLPYVIHPILGIRALPHFTNDFMIV